MHVIDLNLLVTYDALLTERSVTRAAARVGLSQSAMSHNLACLRSLFGDELLTRGMRPTPRALALVNPVRIALSDIRGTSRHDQRIVRARTSPARQPSAGIERMSTIRSRF